MTTESNGYEDSSTGNPENATFLPEKRLPLSDLCAHINAKVTAFLDLEPKDAQMQRVQEQTRTSLHVIDEALKRYDFSELSLSYNGGKDCLVLLILYLAALAGHAAITTSPTPPLQTVYIVSEHPFTEVEDFVQATATTYHLSVTRYSAKDMKHAFAEYLDEVPAVRAIFVGTRRTDPHGANLMHFDATTHGWPSFMRIHPVIDWHYTDIWTFIRHLRIPYCPLYDRGYTSLGGTTDTHRNPALRRPSRSASSDGKPAFEFRPAYELVEDHAERLGRDREWNTTQGTSSKLHTVPGALEGDGSNDSAIIDDDDEEKVVRIQK